jgi:hypothetical protein
MLVLALGLWMFILGTPGLDALRKSDLADPAQQETAFRDYPAPAVWLGIGIAGFNREVRLRVVHLIEDSQRPFRIAQTWNLYRNGPSRVRHMEIRVGGELKYRTQSSEHTWLGPQIGSRRIRPMVESTCLGRRSKNWRGLSRWVVDCALRDFPQATEVSILCQQSPFPGTKADKLSHMIVATAPDWTPRMPK